MGTYSRELSNFLKLMVLLSYDFMSYMGKACFTRNTRKRKKKKKEELGSRGILDVA